MSTGFIIDINSLIFPLIIILIILTISKIKNRSPIQKLIFYCIVTIYLHLLIGITLFPFHIYYSGNKLFHDIGSNINLIPFFTAFNEIVNYNRRLFAYIILRNYIGNILLFIPMGFLLPLLKPSSINLKKAVLYGFCISLSIESTQLVVSLFLSSYMKIFDIDDLIFNIIGMVVGYIIFNLSKNIFNYNKWGFNV